jgi:hypothetical protein
MKILFKLDGAQYKIDVGDEVVVSHDGSGVGIARKIEEVVSEALHNGELMALPEKPFPLAFKEFMEQHHDDEFEFLSMEGEVKEHGEIY